MSSAPGSRLRNPGDWRVRVRNCGLSLVIGAVFLMLMGGQTLSGLYQYSEEQAEHGQPGATLAVYLTTGHFLEATAENWESEFLQMAAYVLLTVKLFQKRSRCTPWVAQAPTATSSWRTADSL